MTRIAVLSDIHANLHALSAVLSALEAEQVDRYLCAGDTVGYGAHPDECIDLLRRLPVVAVAGNHDLVSTGRAPEQQFGALARATLRWTTEHLSPESRTFLENLPVISSTGGIVLTHGSLDSPFEYIVSRAQARAQLALLRSRYPAAELLVHGHTHRAVAVGESGGLVRGRAGRRVRLADGQRYLLNPGSVGQSRQRSPRARFLVLDVEQRHVTFGAASYDIRACKEDLRQHGLPPEGCHLPPTATVVARRALGRLKRRVLRRPT